ncbi:1-acyl-sn-glycerol-3-phosphate acyltransferase [Caldimonas sp. KR1-144]|uniref:1-acyl-sn-glycerol-3-phosphate acyltransferase n=1 Tax=Caldimonas sp. KR1-144 TaxID=3400911 RepID=UPI003C0D66D2
MRNESLPVTFEGSAAARGLLRALGWRVRFHGLPSRQGVIVVYPHTSNWDFPIGLLAKWAIGIELRYWAKDSLFRWPLFGRWMRWVGGVPVVRNAPSGVVGQMAERFAQARERDELLWLAVTPEGTRAWRPQWRSGFYHLALKAGVPLGIARLDWGAREVAFDRFLALSGDIVADQAAIAAAFAGVRGRRAELAGPIEFREGS